MVVSNEHCQEVILLYYLNLHVFSAALFAYGVVDLSLSVGNYYLYCFENQLNLVCSIKGTSM